MRSRLLSLFSPSERMLAFGLLAMMAGGAFLEVLGIGLVVPLVATLTNTDAVLSQPALRRAYEWSGAASSERFALMLLVCFLALVLLKNAYLALLAFLQFRFVYGKQAEVARRLFEGYLTAPYALHLHRHSSEVTRTLVTEVNNLFTGVLIPLLTVGAEGLVLLLLIVMLIFAMPQTALIVLVVSAAIVAVVYGSLRSKLGRYGSERAARSSRRIQSIGDALGGLKELKVLGREQFFLQSFADSNGRYLNASRIFATLNALPRFIIESLAIMLLVATALLLVAVDRDMTVAAPSIVLLCLVALRLMPAATRMLAALASIRFYLPSLDQVHRDLNALSPYVAAIKPPLRPTSARKTLSRGIDIEDLGFAYPGASTSALDGVTLTIPAGTVCALVGASGAGKSTLADLILGVFEPQRGRILIDGCDTRGDLVAWRRCVGYVPQVVHLLDDSVRRNVAFGLPDNEIEDERVWRALRAAQLEALVRALPRALDDAIGEHGMRLSGGQRQRLGIARALYADPPVLILDEATAALDLQTERVVAETLLDMRPVRTVIVIAHRLDTIRRCDRLFFLVDGRLSGSGTYDELVVRDSRFAALVGEATL